MLEISKASIRFASGMDRRAQISFTAPMVRPSSRLIRSLSLFKTSFALVAASSTSFSFVPFFGTRICTLLPFLAESHCSSTGMSSISCCSISSFGINGVPA